MESDQKFKPYQLKTTYPVRVACEKITDDKEGFKIAFSSDQHADWLQIQFDVPLAYRKLDEGDFLRTLAALKSHPRVICYEATNSEFISWFNDETFGIAARRHIRHFVFLSQNDCIEVLSEEPPLDGLVEPRL